MSRRRRKQSEAADALGVIFQAAFLLVLFGFLFAGWVFKKLMEPSPFISQPGKWLAVLAIGTGLGLWLTRGSREKKTAQRAEIIPNHPSSEPWTAPVPRTAPDLSSPDLNQLDWFQFEKLVEVAMARAGYVVRRSGGANADGGIDLTIERDGNQVGVQCKHWKAWKPGVRQIREFVGALKDRGLDAGIFISTNPFTADARALAARQNVELWTKDEMTSLIDRTNAWEDSRVREMLYSGRKQCPKCEREMVLRKPKNGTNEWQHFWGCSGYPRCRFTMQCT